MYENLALYIDGVFLQGEDRHAKPSAPCRTSKTHTNSWDINFEHV